MPDLVGQNLGGYRILSQIGKGGMATVYKAFQPSLERHVAIKVLPAFYAEQDETFLKRFRLEARSVAHLRHPNILTIYEYGEEGGITYIVMEYVPAGTLTDRLGQPMPLREVDPVLRQVAAALGYAHDQGVIHRDVKPSNILLPRPDWPLLTDFGLAKIVGGSTLTLTGTIAGTPAYMSPEQGRGETVGPASDVYSLGIVLYEMLTGVVPFTAETPMAVIVKHMIEPLPLPRNVNASLPEGVEAVVLKALAKQPADRYARADQMAEAFNEAVREAEEAEVTTVSHPVSTVTAAETGPATPTAPSLDGTKPKRRRLLPLALAGLAAGVLLSLAVLAWANRGGGVGPDITQPQTTRTYDQLMADGRAALDAGDAETAVDDFQLALAADPTNLDAYWEVSDLMRDSGQIDYAVMFAASAVAAGPNEAWHHDNAGWRYYYLGEYARSTQEFQRALNLDSESLWSYIGLSRSLAAQGDTGAARWALDSLAAHEPLSDPDLYANLGWGYSEISAHVEAQAAFGQAVGLDPTKVDAWSGLIDATYYTEGVEAAWNMTFEAIAANPEDASLHHKLGDLARERSDTEAAENAYQDSIELDATYSGAYVALAELYKEMGRADDADAILHLGIERNPQDAWLQDALGGLLLERGESEAAYGQFAAASDLDPSYGWFPLEAAEAYYAYTGDTDGTAVWLERAAATQSDDPYLLDGIGRVYEDMGDCPVASQYYSRALEINPDIENSQAGLTRCGG